QDLLDEMNRKERRIWIFSAVASSVVIIGGALIGFASYGSHPHEAQSVTQESSTTTTKEQSSNQTETSATATSTTASKATTKPKKKELDLSEQEAKDWVAAVLNQEFTYYELPTQYDLTVSTSVKDNLVYIDAYLGDLFNGYAESYQFRINAQGELEQSSTKVGWNLVSPEYMNISQVDHLAKIEPEEDLLAGYSDLQIEYARVWLAMYGTPRHFSGMTTEIGVTVEPKGTPIYEYYDVSVNYPMETTTLSDISGIDGGGANLITYGSNHDGSITVFNTSGYWPDFVGEEGRRFTQSIIDDAYVMDIPADTDENVKEVIEVLDF
ncbi:MAG: hypothetical protein ACK5MW_04325, partial [Enterococcus sp.]